MSSVYYKRSALPKKPSTPWTIVDAVYAVVSTSEWLGKDALYHQMVSIYDSYTNDHITVQQYEDGLATLEEQGYIQARRLDEMVATLLDVQEVIREEVPSSILMNSQRLKKLAGYD